MISTINEWIASNVLFQNDKFGVFPPSLFPRCLSLWKYIISEQWASQWKGVYNIFPVDGKGTDSIDYHTRKKERPWTHISSKLSNGIYLPFHCHFRHIVRPFRQSEDEAIIVFYSSLERAKQDGSLQSLQLFLNIFELSRRIQKPWSLERVPGPDVTVDCDVFMCVWVQNG